MIPTDQMVEAAARALCVAKGRSPDMCMEGSGYMSESGGHSECYRFAWQNELHAARSALEAATAPSQAEGAPVRIPGVESQVMVAARELSESQKRLPEWLWYNDDRNVTFGRWPKDGGAAPYIRADLVAHPLPAASFAKHEAKHEQAGAEAAVAKAVRRHRFERTGRKSVFDETLPLSENELDDARAAIEAIRALPISASSEGR